MNIILFWSIHVYTCIIYHHIFTSLSLSLSPPLPRVRYSLMRRQCLSWLPVSCKLSMETINRMSKHNDWGGIDTCTCSGSAVYWIDIDLPELAGRRWLIPWVGIDYTRYVDLLNIHIVYVSVPVGVCVYTCESVFIPWRSSVCGVRPDSQ